MKGSTAENVHNAMPTVPTSAADDVRFEYSSVMSHES